MRVLLTVHQFLPEYSAGTEILTFQVAKELQVRGHEISIFTGYPSQVPMEESERFDSYTYEGITVNRFYHASIPLGTQSNIIEAEYNNLFFAAYFREYLINWQADIVHFFHLGKLSASAIDICVELGIPTVMTATDFWLICPTNQLRLPDGSLCNGPDGNSVNCLRHTVENSQPLKTRNRLKALPDGLVALLIWSIKNKGFLDQKWWFAPYVRALAMRPEFLKERMNQIDRVLVPTHLMQDILQRHGLSPTCTSFVPYGINLGNIERGHDKGTTKQLRVGFIGTLFEHKGAHLLVEAVQRFLPALPIELKIYGSLNEFPEYVSKLYQIAKGDSRIDFCGTFPNKYIGKILLELDVLVVPSIWYENTPLVIYSAQAAGCPVIATNVGGLSEVVHHEVNGLLFEKGNVIDLAKLLQRLHEDRTLLKKLAKNSLPPKSTQEYVNDIENIYKTLPLPEYERKFMEVSGLNQVANFWAKSLSTEEKKLVTWMEHPRVNRQINKRVTGNESINWFEYVQKYFPSPINKALSLGCGEGGLERHGLQSGMVNYFDAIDVSQGSLEKAKTAAKNAGILEKINYTLTDVNNLVLPLNSYDAVFASMSIHHIEALETVFDQISKALKVDGYFICNEYVGPTRFQLPDEQVKLINDLLEILPEELRRVIREGCVTSEIKNIYKNAPLSWFEENDPSESIRSADILPVLEEFFQIVELKSYGGTLLQFLLQDIIGNFQEGKAEHEALLNMLMYFENVLEKKGVIKSDFMLIVATPKV